jgi:hypothetical protein
MVSGSAHYLQSQDGQHHPSRAKILCSTPQHACGPPIPHAEPYAQPPTVLSGTKDRKARLRLCLDFTRMQSTVNFPTLKRTQALPERPQALPPCSHGVEAQEHGRIEMMSEPLCRGDATSNFGGDQLFFCIQGRISGS